MTKNRIVGACAALSLLAVPAVAAAHGSGDDHGRNDDNGRHHSRHHHHKHHGKKAKTREVTGSATGTIASFANGELTITLPSGKSFTADVTRRTVIRCKTAPAPATTARHGSDDGDGSGSGRGGNDDGPNHDVGDDHGDHTGTSTTPATTTAPPTTTVPTPPKGNDDGPNHDANDDHNNHHGVRCGTDALVAGTRVTKAELVLKGGNAVWKKVSLLK
jgi:hypothetical protein